MVIKRNGDKVAFNKDKIILAIGKANDEVNGGKQLKIKTIFDIADSIEDLYKNEDCTVEEIQDIVENSLMECQTLLQLKSVQKY